MEKYKWLYIVATVISLAVLVGCLAVSIVGYEQYIAGHFPLHLVVFGVIPIAIFAVIAHLYETVTGNEDTWYRRFIRRLFGLK